MNKLFLPIMLCIAVILIPIAGCDDDTVTEINQDIHVQELALHDTWLVDSQWELTINLVRYIGTADNRIQVFYDYTNLGCKHVTEGYDALRMAPRVYTGADRETEYRPDEIDIRTASIDRSARKCSYIVASSDGTPINQCWIVFSHTADDGDTYEAEYHITLK